MQLRELTSIRFLAAFWVFLFHFQLRGVLPAVGWRIGNIVSQGALGVTLFFALSGLIMFYAHHQQQHIDFRKFMWKRIARIVPVFWVGALAAFVVATLLGGMPSMSVIALDFALLNSWVPPLSMLWIGGGSWSIATEFFFYFLTIPLIYALRSWPMSALWTVLALALIMAPIPGLLLNFVSKGDLFPWTYTFPPARLAEFVAGMAAGALVLRNRWRVPSGVAVVAVGVAATYLMYFGPRLGGWVVHNAVVLPAIILLLVSLTQPSRVFGWLRSALLVWLGKISYGFYIWQIVLTLAIERLQHQGLLSHHLASWTATAVLLGLNIVLAAVSFRWLETPVHHYISTKIAAGYASKTKKTVSSSSEVVVKD